MLNCKMSGVNFISAISPTAKNTQLQQLNVDYILENKIPII